MLFQTLLNISVGLVLASVFVNCSIISDKKNIQKEKFALYNNEIDSEKYIVQYEIDTAAKSITFEVTVETTGFVGFGLSRSKGMAGADIVIGGVFPNGTAYFSDRYAEGKSEPQIDDEQNWELLGATENGTHTYLRFSRLLDTCDLKQDVAISKDTLSIIWSYGETDDIRQHNRDNRGSKDKSFLFPLPDVDVSKFDKWVINSTMAMPARSTSYWCSMYLAPKFAEKRHIVGFQTILETPEALRHTHHFDLYQCITPKGGNATEIFGPFARPNHPGAECMEDFTFPAQYCYGKILNGWAVGGGPLFLPEHAGYVMYDDDMEENIYVMLQIHYDNPEELADVTFSTAVNVYHTPELRKYDAAMMVMDHQVTYSHMIPPNVKNFVTAGHCPSSCTSRMLPPEGINLFNVFMHSHLAGRKIKVRHFRAGRELPWISYDDNWAFDFQASRHLSEEINIRRGDQVTVECTYETLGRPQVTLGGPSTRQEMCQAIVWYYPKSNLTFCESAYPQDKLMATFGIEEIEWSITLRDPMVMAPPSLANRSLYDVLEEKVKWTPEKIAALEHELRYGMHYEAACSSGMPDFFDNRGHKQVKQGVADITYPKLCATEYVPENTCDTGSTTAPITNTDTCDNDDGSNGNNLVINAKLLTVCIFIIISLVKL